jgi:hypothetical protein
MTEVVMSLDNMESKNNIEYDYTIVCSDGISIKTKTEFFKNSPLLSTLLEDKKNNEIELNFPSTIINDILEYLEYASNNSTTLLDEVIMDVTLKTLVNPWELDYLDRMVKKRNFSLLIKAANFLAIKNLLHLLCGKVASLIKNKKPEEIKTIIDEIN